MKHRITSSPMLTAALILVSGIWQHGPTAVDWLKLSMDLRVLSKVSEPMRRPPSKPAQLR